MGEAPSSPTPSSCASGTLAFRCILEGCRQEEDSGGRMQEVCFGDTELPVAKTPLRGIGLKRPDAKLRRPGCELATCLVRCCLVGFKLLEITSLFVLMCSCLELQRTKQI